MSTQQMTQSWKGTTPVALAEEKLILPLLTMNQSQLCKENRNSPWIVPFGACFWAGKIDFLESKMQCTANHTSNQDDVRYLEKEGAPGEAVCQAQALTKPEKSFSASRGAGFWEISMTQWQFRYSLLH